MYRKELDPLASDWQDTIDLMAEIVDVPAGLIMRLNGDELEVFVASNTAENPYQVGEKEIMTNSGLYCENVINNNRMLKVPNALQDENWKTNPDIKLNMISYLGFPLMWPSGKPFGTICVLDEKENHYTSCYEGLINKFKVLIEKQLEILDKTRALQELAEKDMLTNIYNRRTFFINAEAEFKKAHKNARPFSILLLDIDYFKKVNDTFGHQAGDEVLKILANSIGSVVRPDDIFGRYGGEEFIIALIGMDFNSAKNIAKCIKNTIEKLNVIYGNNVIQVSASIGVGTYEKDQELSSIIARADKALYKAKNRGRNCIC